MDDVKAKHVKDRGIVALANVCEILDSLDPHNRVHVMRYLISRYSACVTLTDPVAVYSALTLDQIEQRLDELDGEREALRYLARAKRAEMAKLRKRKAT